LQIKYGISHDIDTYMVMGMAIPEVQNASGTLAQMGFDHCSGTNNQIGVFSADGATRHIDYITNVVQSVPYGIRIDYSPSSKIVATTGSGLVVIKTSNLPPVAAASNPDNLFRAGIKSLNATQKTLRLFAVRLFGQSHDSVTGVMGWV
jgi:methyl coenzyme M reductase subunit C